MEVVHKVSCAPHILRGEIKSCSVSYRSIGHKPPYFLCNQFNSLSKTSMPSHIHWPEKYLPGTTDNFVSNEIFVKGITAQQVWGYLSDITKWESYYNNASQITPPSSGPTLKKGDKFSFSTFGFPPIQSEVWESVAPSPSTPGRIAWQALHDGDEDSALEVYHAWIVEDMEWGVVRILTQESQIGKPAAQLATTKPNRMLNGHQDWLDGLANITKQNSI